MLIFVSRLGFGGARVWLDSKGAVEDSGEKQRGVVCLICCGGRVVIMGRL